MLLYHPQKNAPVRQKLDDFFENHRDENTTLFELPVPRFFLGRIFFLCVCGAPQQQSSVKPPTHFTISHRDATVEQPQNRGGKTTKKTENKKIRGWKISRKKPHILQWEMDHFEDVCPTSNDFVCVLLMLGYRSFM